MPQYLTRKGSRIPHSRTFFTAGPSACEQGSHKQVNQCVPYNQTVASHYQFASCLCCLVRTHLNIEAHVFVSLVMCGVQFRDELSSLHTRVLSKRTWQRLEGLSKLLNSILLQTRAGLSHKHKVMFVSSVRKCCSHRIRDERAVNAVYLSVGSELLGQFDLCGTCSRYQSLVLGNKHAQR